MDEDLRRPSLVSPKARRLIDEIIKGDDLRTDRTARTIVVAGLGDFVSSDGTLEGARLPLSDAIPPTETFGVTGTAGTSTSPSRGDHQHPMVANPMNVVNVKGDLIAATADNVVTRLPVGADGEFLTAQSAQTTGLLWTPHGATGDPHSQYIAEALVDAKGDLITATAADTPVRMAVSGNNGWVLTEDSAEVNGIKWAAAPGTGSADITVREEDATPSVSPITVIRFPNSSLTDNGGGDVSVAFAGGSGAVVHTSAYGSPPGSPAAGDLWLPTDSIYLLRYSGSAWVPWGMVWLFGLGTDPGTWVNQGDASVSSAVGPTVITAPTAANPTWRMRVKTAPATPYTVTAKVLVTGTGNPGAGLVWRESGTGELIGIYLTGSTLTLQKYTSPTAASTTYVTLSHLAGHGAGLWFRFRDDGTNRITSFSQDGLNFLQIHTIGRTDFLTADQIGFGINVGGATITSYATLVSWVETA